MELGHISVDFHTGAQFFFFLLVNLPAPSDFLSLSLQTCSSLVRLSLTLNFVASRWVFSSSSVASDFISFTASGLCQVQ